MEQTHDAGTGLFKLAGALGTLEFLQGPTGATRGQKVTGIQCLCFICTEVTSVAQVEPSPGCAGQKPIKTLKLRHLCSHGLKQHRVTETHQEPHK